MLANLSFDLQIGKEHLLIIAPTCWIEYKAYDHLYMDLRTIVVDYFQQTDDLCEWHEWHRMKDKAK